MKLAVFGGSVPSGIGYPDRANSSLIYPNILKNLNFDVTNCSVPGGSNYEIFLNCLLHLSKEIVDIVVIELNGFFRFRFYPAPNINVYFSARSQEQPPTSAHYQRLAQRDLDTFFRCLIHLNHDYHDILTLLDYCNIIQSICDKIGTKLVLFNGAVPWSRDLVLEHQPNGLESGLSDYTKNLINFENRSSDEIIKLLSAVREKFYLIDKACWAQDPFKNLSDYSIDFAPEDKHPGPATHQYIADFIYKNILERH